MYYVRYGFVWEIFCVGCWSLILEFVLILWGVVVVGVLNVWLEGFWFKFYIFVVVSYWFGGVVIDLLIGFCFGILFRIEWWLFDFGFELSWWGIWNLIELLLFGEGVECDEFDGNLKNNYGFVGVFVLIFFGYGCVSRWV